MNRNARAAENILDRIVAVKRAEVRALRERAGEVRARAQGAGPVRDFEAALRAGGTVALIAEVKRRSPSAGELAVGLDPAGLGAAYGRGGAACVSVLTDGDFFGGSLADLAAVRAAVELPVLRKDFTIDAIQVDEARAAGADAVLLIVRLLAAVRLRELGERARALGMAAVFEVHDEGELGAALDAGAAIVGVNSRDLATFETRLETALELLPRVPPDVVAVAESGIRDASDVTRLAAAGADAVLVGGSLVGSADAAAAARALAGVARGDARGAARARS